MKAKLFFTIFLVMLTGCATAPQIGSTGKNGATPFILTQNQTKKQIPVSAVVTTPNTLKTVRDKEAPVKITVKPESSNLDKRIFNLEKRVEKNETILSEHSNQISGIKARLAHNYKILADVNRRTTELETEFHLGKKLKQVVINFEKGGTELSNLAKKKLEKIMYENPDMTAKFIIGATDPTGTKEKNTVIAQKRAETVRNYLGSKGKNIFDTKIIIQTETYRYGNCHPQNRVAILHYE